LVWGLVAIMQTIWHRTVDQAWLWPTRFFGTLFLINFAIGVVTGLVQEFEFGMNWSVYSKFVGNVFGAPLAIEGLAAFFLESTFLGLWMKIAASEAQWDTCQPCGFSIFQIDGFTRTPHLPTTRSP
jgi:cytochrome bd-type quinol oxidase subunit 1